MPHLAARMRRLRRLPRRQREAALRCVLPVARGEELEAIAAEALELAGLRTGQADLLLAICLAWPRLSSEARSACVVVAGADLSEVIDRLSTGPEPQQRILCAMGACAIAGEVPIDEDQLPSLLVALHTLANRPGAARAESIDVLAHAIERFGPSDPRYGALLDAAIAEAADRYHEHRHDPLMQAIVRVAPDAGPRLRAWLDARDDAGHLALRAAARREATERGPARAVADLAEASLSSAALATLDALDTPEARALPLAQAHLLESRGRTARLGRLRHPESVLGPSWDRSMPIDARRAAVRWISALPLKPQARIERLAEVLHDPEPDVRMRAVLALRGCPASPAVDTALRDYAFDEDERVAHAALSTLAHSSSKRRREAHADLYEALERSAHPRVRRLASHARLSEAHAEDAQHALVEDLGSADRDVALRALERLSGRTVTDEQARVLVRLVEHADAFVAAKCALLLSNVEGDAARRALLGALGHTDTRVVASAVEAVGKREGAGITLDSFVQSDVARIRANAIRHAMQSHPDDPGARHALAEMLADARAGHRISALWVTERMGLSAMSERVAQMLLEDESEEVRARAKRCATRLLASMREGWSLAAQSPTQSVAG